LRLLHEHALTHNWNAAALGVTQETTEVGFTNQAFEQLGISPDAGFSVTSKSQSSMHALGQQIESLAPVIFLIDGYHPKQHFKNWFTEIFLRDLQSLRAAVIVVVADTPKALQNLIQSPHAQEVFALSQLKAREIRERLHLINDQLHLGVEEAELEHYVKAVRERPERFRSLARLLQLSQTKFSSST
jgi:hypothetical protein